MTAYEAGRYDMFKRVLDFERAHRQFFRTESDAHKTFAPVLVDSRVDDNVRTVKFANGAVIRERIVDVDDERRRVAYSAVDAPGVTHHHASMQIMDVAPGRCRFVWITDFLPAEAGAALAPLIDQGAQALKRTLEGA